MNRLQSPHPSQMIHEPSPKFWSKSNDLRSALQSSVRNQKICEPAPKFQSNDSRSTLAPKFQYEYWFVNYHYRSGLISFAKWFVNPLWNSDLTEMIQDPCSEVLIWIKWLAIRAPKFWFESIVSQTRSEVPIEIKWFKMLQSTDLNIMICAPKFWFELIVSQTCS